MILTAFPNNEVFTLKMVSILINKDEKISKNDLLKKIDTFQSKTGIKYFYINLENDYLKSNSFDLLLFSTNKLGLLHIENDMIEITNWGKLFANSIVLPKREVEYIKKILEVD